MSGNNSARSASSESSTTTSLELYSSSSASSTVTSPRPFTNRFPRPDVICRQKILGPLLVILYGSQTGTAEDIAEQIAREAYRWGIRVHIGSIDSVAFWRKNQFFGDIVFCFVCSTTGQGDCPDNMKKTWLHMLKRNTDLSFHWNSYAVLGLGDSSYDNYNVVAKKLFKRVQQLDGVPLSGVPLGLADDQHECGIEFQVLPWIDTFFEEATKVLLPSEFRNRGPREPKYVLTPVRLVNPRGPPQSTDHPVQLCELIGQERVTRFSHFQDVRLISINIENSGLAYEPGDVLMVQPSNLDDHVDRFFSLIPELNATKNENYYLTNIMPWAQFPAHFALLYPQPWTLEFIVKHFLDLQARPTRRLCQMLGEAATDPMEKDALQNMGTLEGHDILLTYCLRPKRTILEVLEDFASAANKLIPYWLLEMIPLIKPRAFSIAGGSSTQVELLVAVVKYKTSLLEPRIGLCSTWLSRLSIGHQIPVWVEKGTLKFPRPNSTTPIIMVGPGTGVAPFRCFIQARAGENKMILFFGCRNEEKDFYFKDEFLAHTENNALELFTAFSRDNPDGKTYVQDKIDQNASYIGDLLVKHDGAVFIAGNAKLMPAAVRKAITDAVARAGVEDSVTFVKRMEKAGKYQTEVW